MVGVEATSVLACEGLRKTFGERVAVDGVGFTIDPGETYGLLGPNGAGKTTTVECLEGLQRPDAGTVQVLGRDPWRSGPDHRARVGVMLQEGGLPTVSAAELPREARTTLGLIADGGPFPYERDGAVFGNREGLLPPEQRGCYREYTVPTPGEDDRGARRIVTSCAGPQYWTADHYESFSRIVGARL